MKASVQMSGGGPWGFRLYGGEDDPLLVAKLRKRSKAHDAGLQEGDILLAINGRSCKGMSHGSAMGLVDSNNTLTIDVHRGSSDKNAIDAAFQELGAGPGPQPAAAVPGPAGGGPRGFGGQGRGGYTPGQPTGQPQAGGPGRAAPQQALSGGGGGPGGQAVLNGGVSPFGGAPPGGQYRREEKTVREGDTTRHITTETSTQQVGGTTVTKVRREQVSHSVGGSFPVAQQPPQPMFQASSNPAAKKPGVWAPGGGGAAPVVKQNPDQSITMTIGMQAEDAKENIAPNQPMFKVRKFGDNAGPAQMAWQPAAAPARPQPQPQAPPPQAQPQAPPPQPQAQPERMDESEVPLPHEMPYLPLDPTKPMPLHLQRILHQEGSGSDSAPDSPGFFTKQQIDHFGEGQDDGRKLFADSAFYADPEGKYPTVEEQVKMARRVAMSLTAPANKQARGHRMFIKRLIKSEKWSTDPESTAGHFNYDSAEDDDKYYKADPWAKTATWEPVLPGQVPSHGAPPKPPPLPASLFKAPVLPTGSLKDDKIKALSADEFERMRLYEKKSDHTNVSPQVCFNLAEDLRQMKGRGGKLFAKRMAKSEKWVVDETNTQTTPNAALMQKLTSQASDSASGPNDFKPAAAAAPTGADGAPVNRLKDMVDPPKPKMTPWDAMAEYGDVGKAFEHLRGYHPYGRSQKGEIADSLDSALSKPGGPPPPFTTGAPTSGQPPRMPEFAAKIKPWGDNSGAASGGGVVAVAASCGVSEEPRMRMDPPSRPRSACLTAKPCSTGVRPSSPSPSPSPLRSRAPLASSVSSLQSSEGEEARLSGGYRGGGPGGGPGGVGPPSDQDSDGVSCSPCVSALASVLKSRFNHHSKTCPSAAPPTLHTTAAATYSSSPSPSPSPVSSHPAASPAAPRHTHTASGDVTDSGAARRTSSSASQSQMSRSPLPGPSAVSFSGPAPASAPRGPAASSGAAAAAAAPPAFASGGFAAAKAPAPSGFRSVKFKAPGGGGLQAGPPGGHHGPSVSPVPSGGSYGSGSAHDSGGFCDL